ncbi:ferritin-like domain-containing protein [Luteimonas suaedae]|uniref:ferritin-like domain-containing protein n=1 Tax=Luteimonas suaedae TaxID=2605430 RepID=UPI0011ED562E|nr:ferritin-like domain-containing protein [Luteimonas suaedae]
MSMSNRERLLKWLQDAYAMEQEAETMMKSMAGRLKHYPELEARIEAHIAETQQQAEEVKGCIERLDGSTPKAKSAAASVMASVQALGNAMMSDEVVKGVGICYGFEHMEAVSYRALVIAAEAAGEPEVGEVCRRIQQQEQAMAEWLLDHHAAIVGEFLAREPAPDATAKR